MSRSSAEPQSCPLAPLNLAGWAKGGQSLSAWPGQLGVLKEAKHISLDAGIGRHSGYCQNDGSTSGHSQK